jgi:hypothetical protein
MGDFIDQFDVECCVLRHASDPLAGKKRGPNYNKASTVAVRQWFGQKRDCFSNREAFEPLRQHAQIRVL